MIPNTPNRYGELGVWITTGEFDRTVTALRALVLAVEGCDLIYPGGVPPIVTRMAAVEDGMQRARGALWVLTGEEVGRRTSAPSGDRS